MIIAMKVLVGLAMVLLLGASDADAGGRRGGGSRVSGGHGTGSSSSSHSVRGYTTKRGTYVQSYRQTTRDSTQRNNYSAKGNVNPSTGSVGRKPATR